MVLSAPQCPALNAFDRFARSAQKYASTGRDCASAQLERLSLLSQIAMMPVMPSPAPMQTALRVVMMPRDANNYGSIFGGVILSYIDQAGYIEARRHGVHRWVTASIERVDFKAPVHIGDVVSFLTQTESTGTSSVKVRIRVEADRYATGDVVHVTEAHLTMVAVNAAGKPIPFHSAPTVGPGPMNLPGSEI
jgi:acyl-CoA thioesterase YciA